MWCSTKNTVNFSPSASYSHHPRCLPLLSDHYCVHTILRLQPNQPNLVFAKRACGGLSAMTFLSRHGGQSRHYLQGLGSTYYATSAKMLLFCLQIYLQNSIQTASKYASGLQISNSWQTGSPKLNYLRVATGPSFFVGEIIPIEATKVSETV